MYVNNKPITRMIQEGLPQGDVLSPIIFNIYTSELHSIQNNNVVLTQYVDDFNLIIKAKTLEQLETRCQIATANFVEKAEDLG